MAVNIVTKKRFIELVTELKGDEKTKKAIIALVKANDAATVKAVAAEAGLTNA